MDRRYLTHALRAIDSYFVFNNVSQRHECGETVHAAPWVRPELKPASARCSRSLLEVAGQDAAPMRVAAQAAIIAVRDTAIEVTLVCAQEFGIHHRALEHGRRLGRCSR